MYIYVYELLYWTFQKFRKVYEDQTNRGPASEKAQFEYGICLVRSKVEADMKHGVALLQGMLYLQLNLC